MLIALRLSVSLVKVVLAVFCIRMDTAEPAALLRIYLYGSLVLDLAYVGTQVFRIPLVKPIQRGEQPASLPCLSLVLKVQAIAYVLWLIPGNIWFWRCEDCVDEAPLVFSTALFFLILGYFYLLVPALVLFCV